MKHNGLLHRLRVYPVIKNKLAGFAGAMLKLKLNEEK
jgi:hypothetical protein